MKIKDIGEKYTPSISYKKKKLLSNKKETHEMCMDGCMYGCSYAKKSYAINEYAVAHIVHTGRRDKIKVRNTLRKYEQEHYLRSHKCPLFLLHI